MTDGRKTWTPEEINRVVNLRNQGHAWREIGRVLGKSDTMCRRQYERNTGLPAKNRKKLSITPPPSEREGEENRNLRPPLPVGHPVAIAALWSGMERWRSA